MNYCERCDHHHPCASCGQAGGPACGDGGCPCLTSQHKELSEEAEVDEGGNIILFYHWALGPSGILMDNRELECAVFRDESL